LQEFRGLLVLKVVKGFKVRLEHKDLLAFKGL
jgi:hypothetical protein